MSTCDPRDTILGDYGAAQPTISVGSGADTITLDMAMWSTSSITSPVTYTTSTTTGGYTITGTGAGSYNWNTPNYDTVNITGDGITMKDGADIKVGGRSLVESIEKIEARLGILKPNPELEERWEALKDLRKQYIDMEKDLLEKEKIMKILKEK